MREFTDLIFFDFRIKEVKVTEEKHKAKEGDLEYVDQVKYLKNLIDKVKKDIMIDVYSTQKDIDTLKTSKLSSLEFYEFKTYTQSSISKCDSISYIQGSLQSLGKSNDKDTHFANLF